ncbi:toxin [Rouxiella badensis]|uniref:TA system toxin CbtA family protein n=1 Tax=Rouxiella badensis TaxID=1646377 RepID=UPI001D13E59C|nr:TA system toxin CbtA family protein [Rouxiella badensis]MCC3705154.1 toxin [Rouxiella badensis]
MIVTLETWRLAVDRLLMMHFGINIADTFLSEIAAQTILFDSGVKPFEAVNELVTNNNLVHLKHNPFYPRSPYLGELDEHDLDKRFFIRS